jgi:hypothetical protein
MLDIMAPWQPVRTVLNVVEDGGEMVVASLIVAYAVQFAIAFPARAPHPT